MFKHEKQLFHPVEVERPNPQYAVLLQEQLGGGNGELKAAMQYMSQSFRIKDPEIKDLFLDIAAEELGHMEMVAQTINLLNGHDVDATKVQAGEVQTHVLLGRTIGEQIGAQVACDGHVIRRPGIARGIDQSGVEPKQNVRLYLSGLHPGCVYIMTV